MLNIPQPIGRQREVLYLPADGHTVVLGTAGSGKTTLAILRAAYLSTHGTDHYGQTLLVTFNKTLVKYLKDVQQQNDRYAGFVVENYHKFARGYLGCRGKLQTNCICSPNKREALINIAIANIRHKYKSVHPISSVNDAWISSELKWMAQYGIVDKKEYISSRGAADQAHIQLFTVIYEIYNCYHMIRKAEGKNYDWDDIATAAKCELDKDTTTRRYKHIVIDEGQDFSPEMIRSLVKAVPNKGSVTLFADMAQQIYGHQLSWRSAGLKNAKIWEFRENYRNTKQIAKLALAIAQMPYYKGIVDIVEPTQPIVDGPLPVLVECNSPDDEVGFVVELARKFSKNKSVAILFRRHKSCKWVEKLISSAVKLDREMVSWASGPGVYYGTYHAAKGLEFDTVIMPFCNNEVLPDPDEVNIYGEHEAEMREGKLLYVGVTRAKNDLIITYNGVRSAMLPNTHYLYQRVHR